MQFPDSQSLLKLEADLSKLIEDSPRSLIALRKAFEVNPRNAAVARRLARALSANDEQGEATECLRKAVEAKSNDRQLHFAYAQALRKEEPVPGDAILYHLSRSYLIGDKNYNAQLLHLHELFVQGHIKEIRELVERFAKQRTPFWARREPKHPVQEVFRGTVRRVQATYMFVERDGEGDYIYVHRANVDADDTEWRSFLSGTRVRMKVGFTLKGPSACNIWLE